MSLKELTAEKHKLAESAPFMKAVFDKKLPTDLWVDWTFQKIAFYDKIETLAELQGITRDIPEINRAFLLHQDFIEMNTTNKLYQVRQPVIEYENYLSSLSNDAFRLTAHLYTWHMGDLFGGQMIKKIVPGSHKSLEFNEPRGLIEKLRLKLVDSMAKEANIAFDWAIKIMRDYDKDLGEGT